MNDSILKSLVQNYDFSEAKSLPTIDYVYPDFTADGNTEAFRFSSTLREELSDRAHIVIESLAGKEVVWTYNPQILQSVDVIAPRLGINDQLTGKINSIYNTPLLFAGASAGVSREAYVVKPILDGREMAWFEFTNQEKESVISMLAQKAAEKPYKTFIQKMFRRAR